MTIKVIKRNTCPKSWHIGKQITMACEVLELVHINGDEYTWIDVKPAPQQQEGTQEWII